MWLNVSATKVLLAVLSIAMAVSGLAPAAATDGTDVTSDLEALIRRADFDAAEARAATLLRSGALTRPQAARVYLALGVVASARRAVDKTDLAFGRALMLDADLALPPGVGPHVVAGFERARTALATSPPPALPLVRLAAVPGMPRVRIEVGKSSGDGLARSIVVSVAGLREKRELGPEPGEMMVALPASVAGCATASVGLLDEYGNELWPGVARAEVCRPTQTNLTTRPAISSASTSAGLSDRSPARGVSRAVWTTGAVTGALVVATGVLGWIAFERRADYHDSLDSSATFGEQQRLMEDASTAQTRTTVGAIAAGIMAASTLVLYLVDRR